MNIIPTLAGYQITEQIYTGIRTLVYQGIRTMDEQPVVIKILRNEYPNFTELLQFRNQYSIAKNLNFPNIIKPLGLEIYQNSYALVMEDFGGVSLYDYVNISTDKNQNHQPLSLTEFLNIAIQLTDTLHYLYQNRVIHKDIKPANILINSDTKQVKLIDFSISSLLPKETQEIQNLNILEGTLAYISPEQTGRMNRGIDYRSDFYSLGVTFYELLTGELPFVSEDAMELVHCHLAKNPTLIQEKNAEIPIILSEIVNKLMSKNAEERYQSALGIKYDLEKCLKQLQTTGKIEEFILGERDLSDRFTIPEKLYGREKEVNELLAAFERVSTGSAEMMLVGGFSGIGKTAVINEVHKPIVRQRGYFIKGKYDQFQRNIPLSAFVQAFRDLMGQLLSESDEQLQIWKTKILAVVGENGQVLIDVIPELENIIGKQKPARELSGSAAQNRFNLLLQKFVQIFTSKAHPLVMFVDDLQWADSASLNLLELLMQDTVYLLLLGAYRDNEVSPVHPFILTVDEMVKNGTTVNTITLPPLKEIDMNQLIADTLNCELYIAEPLTKLIAQKTKGNPFFATQFLKALYDDKLISFDGEINHWQCDIAQVKALAVTDDVVEFMALQLQKLSRETQEILKLAACVGAEFDLNTLVIVSEKSAGMTATALWKALQEGLLIPITNNYKFFAQSDRDEVFRANANATYRFLHDRVQQAAYSLIPEDQRQYTHLLIARLLQQNTPDTELEAKIFEIVNHWNSAIALVVDPLEKYQLAKLNLTAGHKAKTSAAHKPALHYCQTGLTLLGEGDWKTHFDLTLALHEVGAESAYLCGNFAQMEQWIGVILAQNLSVFNCVKAYEIQIQAYTTQGRFQEAITIARNALQHFNVSLPEKPTISEITPALQEVAALLNDKTTNDLLDLPEMSEAKSLASILLLSSISATTYVYEPLLFSLVILAQVRLSIQKGNIALSAFSYGCYGVLLSSILEDMDAAYAFGQLGLQLVEKLNARSMQAKVNVVAGVFTLHCKAHYYNSLDLYKEAFQVGLEVGDLEYAGYSAMHMYQCHYVTGQNLDTFVPQMEPYITTLQKLNLIPAVNYSQTILQTVRRLQGKHSQTEESAQATQLYTNLTLANDLTGLQFYWVYRLSASYVLNEIAQAIQEAAKARPALAAVASMMVEFVFYFYDSLTAIAAYPDAADKALLFDRVCANQAKLQLRADHAPMNFQHKYDLVEAERNRVLGNKTEAIEFYDRAISGAKMNEFIQEEALANELAAKFYLDWGKEKVAAVYMQEAYYCYARWGAKAKVNDLEKRYPRLLALILQQPRAGNSLKETISSETFTSSESSTNISEVLDLASLLKSSQVISGEIELDKLITTLLEIVVTNAGANKCVLLLKQDVNLKVIALLEGGQSQQIVPSIPLELSGDVPISLVNNVKRNLVPLVLTDGRINSQFVGDIYLQKYRPKSVLCSPILNQGRLIGVLYLENNLTVGAFTNERVEVLNLICSQAAISLENARLYQESQQALTNLKQAQLTIVQSEKMSALGNLVAGVAHEINNPVGFLGGNIQPALDYINDVFGLLDLYQQKYPQPDVEIKEEIENIELDYIREDLPKLVDSMREGVKRIKDISTSLRTFSRADSDRPIACNIHDGIDSTIMILKHRLKANEHRPEIKIIKDYGNLPQIECYAGQLNQVFMNILSNAVDALEESNQGQKYTEITNEITIKTELSEDKKQVIIRIKDNGIGIKKEVQSKIFEHLFTTKSVGKGTGLGLAIARQIIVEKHQGMITVNSAPGLGTEFTILLPMTA